MHLRATIFAALTLMATTQSAAALDACLLGVWEADLTDVTELLRQSDVQGDVTILGGSVTAVIATDSSVTALTKNVAFKLVVDGTETLMTMTGSNAGQVDAANGVFSVTIDEFDLVTELVINGEHMIVPPKPSSASPQESTGTYECSTTELMLNGSDQGFGLQAMPRRWTRLN